MTGSFRFPSFRLTCPLSCLHNDQELFVYAAKIRRDKAKEEAAQCAQRLSREIDEVQRRIDATRLHYWIILAATFDEWMQPGTCAYPRVRA